MSLQTTSSQTVGPYLHIGLTWLITDNLVAPGVAGDPITIDATQGVLNVDIAPQELQRRLALWKQPAPRYRTGVMAKYCALVSSASEGAVTRP